MINIKKSLLNRWHLRSRCFFIPYLQTGYSSGVVFEQAFKLWRSMLMVFYLQKGYASGVVFWQTVKLRRSNLFIAKKHFYKGSVRCLLSTT